MANFPAITPTSRTFKPGVYPQKAYRALNGVVTKRTFGNSPYNAELELRFDNIPDTTTASIINHYKTQTAANQRFLFSTNVTAGMDTTLAALATASGDGLWWEYAGPPAVDSVHPGRSSVSVSFVGEIRDPKQDV